MVIFGEGSSIIKRVIENKYKIGFTGDQVLNTNETVEILEREENSMVVKLNGDTSRKSLLQNFIQQNVEINLFQEILPSLNEIFIHLVNNANHE